MKAKTYFECQACGHQTPKWMGRCPDCGQWNTLVEEKAAGRPSGGMGGAGVGGGAGGGAGGGRYETRTASKPIALTEVSDSAHARVSTGIAELDRVLGGGLVGGSVTLIGGDPGIGKSTLLMQAMSHLKGPVLYVSGEESPEQIKLRAQRLSIEPGGIVLLAETSLENVLIAAADVSPGALVVDSIQTMYTEELSSAPGSVGQVRECAARLMQFAKGSGTPTFLVGHVTKDGTIAGPRVLEHIVDTVLYFEGDRGHAHRILRTVKNRFGSTNEIGVFEMTDSGLMEIENPSELFLSERSAGVSGSAVVPSIEGTRPLLVEVQALVSTTTFGMPRRTSIGADFQRVSLLVAVLEKLGGLQLGGMDIFTNVVGGLKVTEPALDLGIVAAVTSSLREKPLGAGTAVFGEVGLSGEVRAVNRAELRLAEASKMGFKKAVIPATNAGRIRDDFGVEISGVSDVQEALSALGL